MPARTMMTITIQYSQGLSTVQVLPIVTKRDPDWEQTYFNDPAQTLASELGLETAKGIIMTYAEVEFLLAEAAVKGWINDPVETHYRNGIAASMAYYQVDYTSFGWAGFEDYYARSGVAYAQPTDVWEQKWLSLFFTGLEPYFELRRWYFESDFDWKGIPFMGPGLW